MYFVHPSLKFSAIIFAINQSSVNLLTETIKHMYNVHTATWFYDFAIFFLLTSVCYVVKKYETIYINIIYIRTMIDRELGFAINALPLHYNDVWWKLIKMLFLHRLFNIIRFTYRTFEIPLYRIYTFQCDWFA